MDESWRKVSDVPADDPLTSGIDVLLRTFDFEQFALHALHIRRQSEPLLSPTVTCEVDKKQFAAGRFNFVFVLKYTDGRRWIVRIQRAVNGINEIDGSDGEIGDCVDIQMLEEVAIMQLVGTETDIPIPQVHECNAAIGPSNKFGYRYMLMDLVEGDRLGNRNIGDASPDEFARFTKQFSSYLYQLNKIRFTDIGKPVFQYDLGQLVVQPLTENDPPMIPNHTSLAYLFQERLAINQAAFQILPGSSPRSIHAAGQFLLQQVPLAVLGDHLGGPFPLTHSDMHGDNILIDDEFNITGIIDWSAVRALPIEIFAANYQFRTYPLAPAKTNIDIIRFRSAVADEFCRLATQAQDNLGVATAGLIGTTKAQLANLLACSPSRLLIDDASIRVLPLIHGKDAKWEDIERLILAGPISAELEALTPAGDVKCNTNEEHDGKPDNSVLGKRCHGDSTS